MTKTRTIEEFLAQSTLRSSVVGLGLLSGAALVISLILARNQTASDLREQARAVAEAFHDRIVDGDIRSVEAQMANVLQTRENESALILRSDLARVYERFANGESIRPCPRLAQTCFDGIFGEARIFYPISMERDGTNPFRYLYSNCSRPYASVGGRPARAA